MKKDTLQTKIKILNMNNLSNLLTSRFNNNCTLRTSSKLHYSLVSVVGDISFHNNQFQSEIIKFVKKSY